jgi:phospholipid/cholesterol/gamma-HCH transport system substrate-binding protein
LNQEGNLFNELVTDTTIVTEIKSTMSSLKTSAENTEKLTNDLNTITEKFNSKENAIGVFLNDPQFAEDLRSTLVNTDSATYNLNKGLEALPYTWPFRKGFKRKAKEEGKSDN